MFAARVTCSAVGLHFICNITRGLLVYKLVVLLAVMDLVLQMRNRALRYVALPELRCLLEFGLPPATRTW